MGIEPGGMGGRLCGGVLCGVLARDGVSGTVGAMPSAAFFATGCGGGASTVGRSSASSSMGGRAAVEGAPCCARFAEHAAQRIGPRTVNGGRGIWVPHPLQRIATR